MLELLFDVVLQIIASFAMDIVWRVAYGSWGGQSKAMQWMHEGR